MRKIAIYLLAAASLCLASCISMQDDIIPVQDGKKLIVMASVADFNRHDVNTKALEEEESRVNDLTMIIFDSDNAVVGHPVNLGDGNSVFMIDTQNALIIDGNNEQIAMTNDQAKLDACSIYMVANCWHVLKDKTINNLTDLLTTDIPVEAIDIPDTGIPMMGVESGFDLSKDRGDATTVADIVMDKLYSKINVRFQVNADQVVNTPSFNLSGWTVSNIPANVRLGEPATGEETANANGTVLATTDPSTTLSYGVPTITHSESAANPDYFQFTFYVPEHRVNPKGTVTYPTGMPETEQQRYKPLLCTDSQKPMYVTVTGSYTDHHAQVKEVTYSLYLGQNNKNDFHINRNQELNNIITIKGLTNSKDAIDWVPEGGQDNISVDHRVEVVDAGFSIAMEREALLDSHFEVRPMDVFVSAGGKVVVTVNSDDADATDDWLRIEKSTESDAHIAGVGVRKYFTTDLVTTTLASTGRSVTINSGDDSRIWLYFDENTNVYDKTVEGSQMHRDITLTVDYYADANSAEITKTQTFSFRQMNLWRVRNADNTRYYDIEYHEEYLYNYVSNDNYGKTTDGMAWGLDGINLSNKQKAAYVDNSGGIIKFIFDLFGSFEGFVNDIIENSPTSPYYDFYMTRDDPFSGITPRDYSGYVFNQEIIATLTSLYNDSSTAADVKAKVNLDVQLNADPVSAISYCYNKNKRQSSGSVSAADHNWYLPSIDEIEDITINGYSDFEVFQNKLYWSCQPSFENNKINVKYHGIVTTSTADGAYKSDDVDRARSTRVSYNATTDKFENVSSAVTGNTSILTAYNGRAYTSDFTYTIAASGETISFEEHEGNKPRSNWKNRIRCVRNSGKVSELNATN